MSPLAVRRALLLFAAGLLLSALGFTALVGRHRPDPVLPDTAPAAPDGAALFDARCGGCHRIDEVAGFVRARPDVETGRRALRTLLERHGDVTVEEAAAIVRFVTPRD